MLFTLAAGVSAVSCALVLIAWVGTWRMGHQWRCVSVVPPPNPTWRLNVLGSEHGMVGVLAVRIHADYTGNDPRRGKPDINLGGGAFSPEEEFLRNLVSPGLYHDHYPGVLAGLVGPERPSAGFLYSHDRPGVAPLDRSLDVQHDRWRVSAPSWFLTILTACIPAAWLRSAYRARRTRRRLMRGGCPTCGYDLIPSPRPVIAILPDQQQR